MSEILLFDLGSYLTLHIKRVLDDFKVEYSCVDHNFKYEDLPSDVKGIILSGSPQTVYEGGIRCDSRFLTSKIPTFGICYGQQLCNDEYGGKVEKSLTPEFDKQAELIIDVDNPLFEGMDHVQGVAMFHNDEVTKLGEGFVSLAHTKDCKYAATYNEKQNIYTVQFHPEFEKYTKYSKEYFDNFLKICGIIKS